MQSWRKLGDFQQYRQFNWFIIVRPRPVQLKIFKTEFPIWLNISQS